MFKWWYSCFVPKQDTDAKINELAKTLSEAIQKGPDELAKRLKIPEPTKEEQPVFCQIMVEEKPVFFTGVIERL
jgi:hypothetical protein